MIRPVPDRASLRLGGVFVGLALSLTLARTAAAQCSNLPDGAQNQSFDSNHMGGDWPYVIYLPPGYDASAERYPVVYWFHGRGDSQCNQAPLAADIDAMIESGDVPPMIYVFFNGGAQCDFTDDDPDCPDRDPESYFIEELIPHIDSQYRTIATPNGRALEGWSMGAAAVLRYFYKYTDDFCSTVAIAPGNDIPSDVDAVARGKISEKGTTTIRIVVGSEDQSHLVPSQGHVEQLTDYGLLHEFEIVDGIAHNPSGIYRAENGMDGTVGERNLRLHARCFAEVTVPNPSGGAGGVGGTGGSATGGGGTSAGQAGQPAAGGASGGSQPVGAGGSSSGGAGLAGTSATAGGADAMNPVEPSAGTSAVPAVNNTQGSSCSVSRAGRSIPAPNWTWVGLALALLARRRRRAYSAGFGASSGRSTGLSNARR